VYFFHTPACISAFASPNRRASAIICPIISSKKEQNQNRIERKLLTCNGATIGKRGVENRDATTSGCGKVNLIGSDAEASDRNKTFGSLQHLSGDIGGRPNTKNVHILQLGNQLFAVERVLALFN
jgi:hypothetical protein